MAKHDEVPGDARESALRHQERMVDLGQTLARADQVIDTLHDDDIMVRRLTIRVPEYLGGEYLVVVGADTGGAPVVGFHTAHTFGEAVRGVLNRLAHGSIQWKEDAYANKKHDSGG